MRSGGHSPVRVEGVAGGGCRKVCAESCGVAMPPPGKYPPNAESPHSSTDHIEQEGRFVPVRYGLPSVTVGSEIGVCSFLLCSARRRSWWCHRSQPVSSPPQRAEQARLSALSYVCLPFFLSFFFFFFFFSLLFFSKCKEFGTREVIVMQQVSKMLHCGPSFQAYMEWGNIPCLSNQKGLLFPCMSFLPSSCTFSSPGTYEHMRRET